MQQSEGQSARGSEYQRWGSNPRLCSCFINAVISERYLRLPPPATAIKTHTLNTHSSSLSGVTADWARLCLSESAKVMFAAAAIKHGSTEIQLNGERCNKDPEKPRLHRGSAAPSVQVRRTAEPQSFRIRGAPSQHAAGRPPIMTNKLNHLNAPQQVN